MNLVIVNMPHFSEEAELGREPETASKNDAQLEPVCNKVVA